MSEYFGFTPQFPSTNPPCQCFPNIFFLADPLWLRKITMDPPILAHKNIQCQDDRCPKVNIYISVKVLGRYEYTLVEYIILNCMICANSTDCRWFLGHRKVLN